MARAELGTTQTCSHCSTKFYDLNRNPVACPKCGKENDYSIKAEQKTETIETVKKEKAPTSEHSEQNGDETEELLIEDIDSNLEENIDEADDFLDTDNDELANKEFAKAAKENKNDDEASF